MSDFKPPKLNKALVLFTKFLLPYYLKFVERLSFKFSQSAAQPVEFLKGKKAVIVINHSDKHDPWLLMELARYVNEEFYCVVARESFDAGHGFYGWVFQRLGCFSVERGAPDFKSIHTMMTILKEGTNKLVIFPEAEVTGNDLTVHEINPALMKVFLNAQKSLAHGEARQDLWILPVGVSYRLETKLSASIDKTLKEIERQLGVKDKRWIDASSRVTHDVATLLQKLSVLYEFELPEQ
ncbi:MAG: 1-acyl-sn-glycerol-3-phosphate acyltransferase, partial [Cyanobacteria bacterium]|nr:1-acyl-sn-glycerol-3-phosphate acyltransferase [Cyanobacteriota bacterium]